MERIVSLTTFSEERAGNPSLVFWLSRGAEERIAEVERLRREYWTAIQGAQHDGLPPSFADLCSLLNARGIEYLIIGGYAVAFHGAPRFTGDLDILVHPSAGQVGSALDALKEFGFPTQDLSPEYLLTQEKILQLGRVPVQVHVMTNISGLSWEAAWESRQPGKYGDVAVFFIGREALMANKRASGRAKDLADIEALGE
jgi:hypothetical protein